jgi:hypothetical protein
MNNMKKKPLELTQPHERLLYLRSLIRRPRVYFNEKYGLPEASLRLWESKQGPISDKAIKRCIDLYKQEGIIVTERWLKDGSGPMPLLNSNINIPMSIAQDQPALLNIEGEEEENVLRDIEHFQKLYPHSVIYFITDDSMLPAYNIGDVVCGLPQYNNFVQFNYRECIALLESGEYVFRKFIMESEGRSLTSTNPLSRVGNPVIFNAKIQMLAPIIWHRKKL